MRVSPHEGFSFAIRRISAGNSAGIGGRPGRDFRRQNIFQHARCQRINVCERTTTKASRQPKNPDRTVSAMRVIASAREPDQLRWAAPTRDAPNAPITANPAAAAKHVR
jgi:hypothetical protein